MRDNMRRLHAYRWRQGFMGWSRRFTRLIPGRPATTLRAHALRFAGGMMTPRNTVERQLAAVLLLRSAANVALCAWILIVEPSWGALFDGAARYALIDGTFGLVSAALLVRDATIHTPAFLAGITATDGITRIV